MCCEHNPEILVKLRRRKKPFVAWKILFSRGAAMYCGASCGQYGPGFNHAKDEHGKVLNQSYKYPAPLVCKPIRGLHLYKSKERAEVTCWVTQWGGKVVRVLVNPKDLIGAGTREIVATKVRILQKDWKASKMPAMPAKTRVV